MTVVAKAPGVCDLEIDAEFLVFDGEHVHRLTGPAADVWRSIQGSLGVEDIVRRVQKLHPGNRRVPADVRAFLENLLVEGLLAEQTAPTHRFAIPPYVAWCSDAHGSAVIADLRSGERFQLSAVAADIWSLTVVDAATPGEAEAALREKYPDAPDDLDTVIADLHESLVDSGLLERSA